MTLGQAQEERVSGPAGAAEIFGRMTTAQRLCVLRLHEARAPWRLGEPGEFPDRAQRESLAELGLTCDFVAGPVPVGSPRRFVMLNVLGYRVLGYALEWRDAHRRAAAFAGFLASSLGPATASGGQA